MIPVERPAALEAAAGVGLIFGTAAEALALTAVAQPAAVAAVVVVAAM